MNKQTIITALLALVAMAGQAQEARIDTIVPKFLINGYFFREMPKLPDATPSVTRLKDKEGNSLVAIGLNVDLPKLGHSILYEWLWRSEGLPRKNPGAPQNVVCCYLANTSFG